QGLRSGLGVTTEQLRAYIAQVPVFQDENKQFSRDRYQEFLRAREMTAPMFENRLRHDLLISLQQDAYVDTSFVPRTVAERLARHILITVDKSAPDAEKQKARALAESLSAELRKNPAKFAELAKKHSQDPGSAAKGGELGAFPRGVMVKAFDDAVFSMKPEEVSAPVETEYGYHVLRVTGITPGEVKSFEQARPEIERELKKIG